LLPHKRNDDVAPDLNRYLRLPSSAAEVCILSAMPGARRLIRKFLLPGAVALAFAGCAATNTPPLPLHDPKLFPTGGDFASATPAEARQFCNEGYSIWCPHVRDSQPQPAPAAAAPAPIVDPHALGGAPKDPQAPVVDPYALGGAPKETPVPPNNIASPVMNGHSEIALHGEGGAFTVPVSINGAITLQFTIDSGAADVSIPADVVLTLMRTGTIGRGDFLGNRTYVMADGSTAPSPTFRIRSLRVGDREVRNVTGSIAPVKGGLLLGQSFLTRFGSWSIDNRRGVLVLD
jgi:hypothetical protein